MRSINTLLRINRNQRLSAQIKRSDAHRAASGVLRSPFITTMERELTGRIANRESEAYRPMRYYVQNMGALSSEKTQAPSTEKSCMSFILLYLCT